MISLITCEGNITGFLGNLIFYPVFTSHDSSLTFVGGFWDNMENQHQFMKYVSEKLNIGDDMEKWYSVNAKQIKDLGGAALLLRYKSSPYLLMQSTFPYVSFFLFFLINKSNYKWLPWKFHKAPGNYRNFTWALCTLSKLLEQCRKSTSIHELCGWKIEYR